MCTATTLLVSEANTSGKNSLQIPDRAVQISCKKDETQYSEGIDHIIVARVKILYLVFHFSKSR